VGGRRLGSDHLGVNEWPDGHCGSSAQVKGWNWSDKVDVGRCRCCTLLLHVLTFKRQLPIGTTAGSACLDRGRSVWCHHVFDTLDRILDGLLDLAAVGSMKLM